MPVVRRARTHVVEPKIFLPGRTRIKAWTKENFDVFPLFNWRHFGVSTKGERGGEL